MPRTDENSQPAVSPYTGNEPLVSWTEAPSGSFKHNLTGTGLVCILVPWLLLLRGKIQYTLFEFMVFIAAWGSSAGFMITKTASRSPWPLIALSQYAVFHSHCYTLVSAVYALSWNRGMQQELRKFRLPSVIVLQLLPLLFWCTMSLIIGWKPDA